MANRTTILVAFSVGVVVSGTFTPVWKHAVRGLMQTHYAELTYRCDRAMRHHLISRRKLELAPSPANVNKLKSAELGLVDCQDYDILRKQLLIWGLDENDLALMALYAIEAKTSDLQDVVRIHELQY